MGMKGGFFSVIIFLLIITAIQSAYALEYRNFESREKFTDFLDQADNLELDLRDDYETSMSIKEQAKYFDVDLNYYSELKLYENIFSRFSWYITGFATGSISKDPKISFFQEKIVPGQKVMISLSNLNYLMEDQVVILAGGETVAAFQKKDIKETSIEVTIPNLEPGKYRFEIKGANAYSEFEISSVEIENDPVIKLSKTSIRPGETLRISGINIPKSNEKAELRIIANGKAISSVQYPAQGVFEYEFYPDIKPGTYTISLEDMESASAQLVVEVPYNEPLISVSENIVKAGDRIIISGKNFGEEKTAELFVFSFNDLSEEKIGDITVNGGNFERFFDTSYLKEGSYRIYSKDFPSAESEFKIKEPDELLPLLKTDMASVEQGQEITLMGENFEEEGKAVVSIDGISEINALCNEQGRFSIRIQTSELYLGIHKIYLKDNKEISVPFSVEKRKPNPFMHISTEKIKEGQSFELTGENFFETGRLKIYIEDSYAGEVSPDAKGRFIISITSNKGPGAYIITAKDTKGVVISTAALNIIGINKPVIKIITDPVYTGGEFKVKGFFFEPRRTELKIGDTILSAVNPDNDGKFETAISLSGKDIGAGAYKLYAKYAGSEDAVSFSAINIVSEKPVPEIKIKNENVYEGDILEITGRYFDKGKLQISIGQNYRDMLIVPDTGAFDYEANISSAGIMKGSYTITAGDVSIPLNVYPRKGPVLKVSEDEVIFGEKLSVYGSGFSESLPVILIIDESLSYSPISENGYFEQEINTFETGAGIHMARVQGYDSAASFNVKKAEENTFMKTSSEEIILGEEFEIYGYNFNLGNEKTSIPVKIGDITYTANIVNGNFRLSLDSTKLGLGYHAAEAEGYSVSFTIVEGYNPHIEVVNESITIGQDATVKGYNFPDSAGSADILVDGQNYKSVSINEGEFTFLIGTEGMQEGHHTVGAEGWETVSGFYVSKAEEPMPEIKISHKTATMGMMLSVEGFNIPYSPQKILPIKIDGEELMQIGYPEKGTFTFSFLVPAMEEGEHIIEAEGFSTAKASFIYSSSTSTDPEIVLSENEARAGDMLTGVANNLPKGIVMRMDIIMDNMKIGNIQSSGIGSYFFSFYVPEVAPGKYDLGLAGISPDIVELTVLADPEPVEIRNYTDYEIEEIKAEVKDYILSISEEEDEEKEQESINTLQERILFGELTRSISKDTCVPLCTEKCGQLNGCGSRCGAEDMNVEGRCGNPVKKDTSFEKGADRLSETATGVMKFALGLD